MVFLDELKSQKIKLSFLVVFLTIFLLYFWQTFGFHYNNDTDGFIYSIQMFRGQDAELYANRYLNPFYPVIASKLLFFIGPVQALITINILFFFGTALLTYGLVRRVFKNDIVGLSSAIIIATAYPMVRYALTQVQDLGGYFWFVATLYCGWRWYESRDYRWLVVAGTGTAFGLLTKESGAMAAVFVGLLILINKSKLLSKFYQLVIFSIFPFITLIINKFRGRDVDYDSTRWFIDNWKIYFDTHYTFFKWAAINLSTFNFVWPLFFLGLILLYLNRKSIDKSVFVYLLAILPSSLSYFAWPLFISRTVFISAWLIVPIASYFIARVFASGRKSLAIVLFVVAIITPSVLQNTLRYAHVFKIYDDCQKDLVCSWQYFWSNRNNFSKEF